MRRMTGSNGTGARFSESSLSSVVVVKLGAFGGVEDLVALLMSIDVLVFALPWENLHRGSPRSSNAGAGISFRILLCMCLRKLRQIPCLSDLQSHALLESPALQRITAGFQQHSTVRCDDPEAKNGEEAVHVEMEAYTTSQGLPGSHAYGFMYNPHAA